MASLRCHAYMMGSLSQVLCLHFFEREGRSGCFRSTSNSLVSGYSSGLLDFPPLSRVPLPPELFAMSCSFPVYRVDADNRYWSDNSVVIGTFLVL